MKLRSVLKIIVAIYQTPRKRRPNSPYRIPYRVMLIFISFAISPSMTYALTPITETPGQALGLSLSLSCGLIALFTRFDIHTICAIRVTSGHLKKITSEERMVLLRLLMERDKLAVSLITKEEIISADDIDPSSGKEKTNLTKKGNPA